MEVKVGKERFMMMMTDYFTFEDTGELQEQLEEVDSYHLFSEVYEALKDMNNMGFKINFEENEDV